MIRFTATAILFGSMLTASVNSARADFDAAQRAYNDGDYATAIREYKLDGSAGSHYALGQMYAEGKGAKQRNSREAMKWYRRAAEQGHAKAQYALGLMYAIGEEVSANKAEAAKWYRKAAEQGHTGAQFLLGDMYASGHGVPQHDSEAVRWCREMSAVLH